ncbi:MAG: hypothetical protein RRZ73_05690 [Oscillospiraceae bacterium]
MFFETALIILSMLMPFMVIFAYRQGLKDSRAIKDVKPIESLIKPSVNAVPDTDSKVSRILDNINIYDGTDRGQSDV